MSLRIDPTTVIDLFAGAEVPGTGIDHVALVVEGVKTSLPLHRELLEQPDVLSGDYSIKWLEEWLREREA